MYLGWIFRGLFPFHGSQRVGASSWMSCSLKLFGMSWGVKTTCLEAAGVSLGGSGVSIGGVGSLRVGVFFF